MDKATKKRWGILFIVIIIGFLAYTYSDPIITQRHGIEMWNALFSGNFFRYYQYCADHTDFLAVYDFSTYLVFAIWNFPCWIYEKVTGTDALTRAFWIFYGKALMLAVFFIYLAAVRRLLNNLRSLDNEYAFLGIDDEMLVFACSIFILMYDLYTGNYDLIETVLVIYGLDALISNRYKQFLLFFALAVSMKYFAAWILIPIILLKEKRILRVLLNLIACFSITLFENLIWDKSRVIIDTGEYLERLPSNAISSVAGSSPVVLDTGSFSLCLVLYAILCICCYMIQCNSEVEQVRWIIFASMVAWLIFFTTCYFNCYWTVLMSPFLCLLLVHNRKNLFINLILEGILTYSIVFKKMIDQHWVIGGEGSLKTHALLNMTLHYITGSDIVPTQTIGEVLWGIDANMSLGILFHSATIFAALALIVINCPTDRFQNLVPKGYEPSCQPETMLKIRNAVALAMYIIPTVYYVIQIIGSGIAA